MLKFVSNGPLNNISALAQIVAWRRPVEKTLSEQLMVQFTDAYVRHLASMNSATAWSMLDNQWGPMSWTRCYFSWTFTKSERLTFKAESHLTEHNELTMALEGTQGHIALKTMLSDESLFLFQRAPFFFRDSHPKAFMNYGLYIHILTWNIVIIHAIWHSNKHYNHYEQVDKISDWTALTMLQHM